MNHGMSFSVQAYRAIKVLIYLAAQDEGRQVTLGELVEALGDRLHSVRDAAAALSRHGFTTGRGGVTGGIRLNLKPEDIRLDEVFLKTAPKTRLNICRFDREDADRCDCYMSGSCAISQVYAEAMSATLRSFERRRVSDLLTPGTIRHAKDAASRYLANASSPEA